MIGGNVKVCLINVNDRVMHGRQGGSRGEARFGSWPAGKVWGRGRGIRGKGKVKSAMGKSGSGRCCLHGVPN